MLCEMRGCLNNRWCFSQFKASVARAHQCPLGEARIERLKLGPQAVRFRTAHRVRVSRSPAKKTFSSEVVSPLITLPFTPVCA
jgi:hypothetical protein